MLAVQAEVAEAPYWVAGQPLQLVPVVVGLMVPVVSCDEAQKLYWAHPWPP